MRTASDIINTLSEWGVPFSLKTPGTKGRGREGPISRKFRLVIHVSETKTFTANTWDGLVKQFFGFWNNTPDSRRFPLISISGAIKGLAVPKATLTLEEADKLAEIAAEEVRLGIGVVADSNVADIELGEEKYMFENKTEEDLIIEELRDDL